MTTSTDAADPETLLKERRLIDALQALTAQVRAHPADAARRVFLFQLLALLGQWERAANQLEVAGELDARNALMVSAYQLALRGERERAEVFSGARTPTMPGEPSGWQALLLQALQWQRQGRIDEAHALREQAFEAADAVRGSIDGAPFEWIADADSRLGPCLELIVNGGYAWVPFSRLSALHFDAPTDLRDKVWAPVRITWRNGGDAVGFVPCRYDGSDRSADPAIVLAARTDWTGCGEVCYVGSGQRMFVTEAGDYPLLDVRTLTFETC
ncbi:type VI secretion system accessory protein TagJ [Paraburkholderia humisilvae]|uniref:Virulence protein SciE type n=1 Tax=Paraburkholderia humisilvae TaxID=627669 RepID=A0A6J5D9Y4_9BURK|nr:type VI secretion system accessory protein TagJ [Paraburkholderia humisilvae]CAB3751100.1 hypothetical protein LMG29542_01413 [Paraburkholderia humisilvae]